MNKYAKLRDDLAAAVRVGMEAEAGEKDCGSCNFDAPSLYLPRWLSNEIKQAARLAGTRAEEWIYRDVKAWIFEPKTTGQAHRRTVNAEAMCHELQKRGYTASMYYRMD